MLYRSNSLLCIYCMRKEKKRLKRRRGKEGHLKKWSQQQQVLCICMSRGRRRADLTGGAPFFKVRLAPSTSNKWFPIFPLFFRLFSPLYFSQILQSSHLLPGHLYRNISILFLEHLNFENQLRMEIGCDEREIGRKLDGESPRKPDLNSF